MHFDLNLTHSENLVKIMHDNDVSVIERYKCQVTSLAVTVAIVLSVLTCLIYIFKCARYYL